MVARVWGGRGVTADENEVPLEVIRTFLQLHGRDSCVTLRKHPDPLNCMCLRSHVDSKV